MEAICKSQNASILALMKFLPGHQGLRSTDRAEQHLVPLPYCESVVLNAREAAKNEQTRNARKSRYAGILACERLPTATHPMACSAYRSLSYACLAFLCTSLSFFVLSFPTFFACARAFRRLARVYVRFWPPEAAEDDVGRKQPAASVVC